MLNKIGLYELVIGLFICIVIFVLLLKNLINSFSKNNITSSSLDVSKQNLPESHTRKIEEMEKIIKEISSVKSTKEEKNDYSQIYSEIDSLKAELKKMTEVVNSLKKDSNEYLQLKSKLDEIINIIRLSGLP